MVFSVIPLWVSELIKLSESERKTEWTKWSTQFPFPQCTAKSSLLIIAGGNVYCWSAYPIWGALVLKWSIKSRYRSIIFRLAKRRKSFIVFYWHHARIYAIHNLELNQSCTGSSVFANQNFDSFSLETSLHAAISFYETVECLDKPAFFKL